MKLVVAITVVLSQVSLHSCRARHSVSFVQDASSEVTLVSPHKNPTLAQLIPILEGLESPETKISKLKKLIPIYDELNKWRLNNGKRLVKIMPLKKKLKEKPLAFILAGNKLKLEGLERSAGARNEHNSESEIKNADTEIIDHKTSESQHTRPLPQNASNTHDSRSSHSQTQSSHTHTHSNNTPHHTIADDVDNSSVEKHNKHKNVVYHVKLNHKGNPEDSTNSDYDEFVSGSNESQSDSIEFDSDFNTESTLESSESNSESFVDRDSNPSDLDLETQTDITLADFDSESSEAGSVSDQFGLPFEDTNESIVSESNLNFSKSNKDSNFEDIQLTHGSETSESVSDLEPSDYYSNSESSEPFPDYSQPDDYLYSDSKSIESDSISDLESSESNSISDIDSNSELNYIESLSSSETNIGNNSRVESSELKSQESLEVVSVMHNTNKHHESDNTSKTNAEDESVLTIGHVTKKQQENDDVADNAYIVKHHEDNGSDDKNQLVAITQAYEQHENNDAEVSILATANNDSKRDVVGNTSMPDGKNEPVVTNTHMAKKQHENNDAVVSLVATTHNINKHNEIDEASGSDDDESVVVTTHMAKHKHNIECYEKELPSAIVTLPTRRNQQTDVSRHRKSYKLSFVFNR